MEEVTDWAFFKVSDHFYLDISQFFNHPDIDLLS